MSHAFFGVQRVQDGPMTSKHEFVDQNDAQQSPGNMVFGIVSRSIPKLSTRPEFDPSTIIFKFLCVKIC